MILDRDDIETSESVEMLSELLNDINTAEDTLECALLACDGNGLVNTPQNVAESTLMALTKPNGIDVYLNGDSSLQGVTEIAGKVFKVVGVAARAIADGATVGWQELNGFYDGFSKNIKTLQVKIKDTRVLVDNMHGEPKSDTFALSTEALVLSSNGVVCKDASEVIALIERVTDVADYILNTWSKEVYDLGKVYAPILRSYKPNDEELAVKITEKLIAATEKLNVDKLINGIKAVKQTDGKYGNVPTYRSDSLMSNLSLYVLHPAKALPSKETVARVAAAHRGLDIKLGKHTKFKLTPAVGSVAVYTTNEILAITDACKKLADVVDDYLSTGRGAAMIGIGEHIVDSLKRDMGILERNIELGDSRYIATVYRFATTYQRLATSPMTYLLPQIRALINGALTTCRRSASRYGGGTSDDNE